MLPAPSYSLTHLLESRSSPKMPLCMPMSLTPGLGQFVPKWRFICSVTKQQQRETLKTRLANGWWACVGLPNAWFASARNHPARFVRAHAQWRHSMVARSRRLQHDDNSHSEERFSSWCQQFLDEAEKRMLGFGLFLPLSSPTFSQALLGSFCQVVPILFVVMVAFPPATTIYPIWQN